MSKTTSTVPSRGSPATFGHHQEQASTMATTHQFADAGRKNDVKKDDAEGINPPHA